MSKKAVPDLGPSLPPGLSTEGQGSRAGLIGLGLSVRIATASERYCEAA